MHLGGALADATHARLAIPAFQRELLGNPVAAVDLDGAVDDAAEDLARVDLGDRGLHARVLAAVGFHAPSQMSQRAARSSTSASASIHWIAWRWLSGTPNVERCLAWAIARRGAAAATTRLHAEYGNRRRVRRSRQSWRPRPCSPRRFSAGTVQSSRTTSFGTATVRIVRIGRAVKPGVPFSMMKQEIPSRPFARSVRTKTTPHSASWAWEMNIFVPFSTQWSPRFSPRLWIAPAGSEPPLGSVIAKKV